jgi:hypothetical protein
MRHHCPRCETLLTLIEDEVDPVEPSCGEYFVCDVCGYVDYHRVKRPRIDLKPGQGVDKG